MMASVAFRRIMCAPCSGPMAVRNGQGSTENVTRDRMCPDPRRIRRRSRGQALAQERDHLVERVACRMTRLVDEVEREHGVCAPLEAVRVAAARVDLDRDESIAELLAQALEAP